MDKIQYSAESLVDSALALEELGEDLRSVVRDEEFTPMEEDILKKRLAMVTLDYGLENLGNLEAAADHLMGAWGLVKRMGSASAVRFKKLVESMRIAVDRSGKLEIKRLHRLLEETQGEGNGAFEDKSLAAKLQINGDVPKDLGQPVVDLLEMGKRIIQHVLPETVHLVKDGFNIAKGAPTSTPQGFADEVQRLIKLVAASKPVMARFDHKDISRRLPGGRRLFKSTTAFFGDASPYVKDPESQKVYQNLKEIVIDIDRRGYKVSGHAYNARLPVLDRGAIADMLRLLDSLSDQMVQLLKLAEAYQNDHSGADVALALDVALQQMRGKLVKGADGSRHDTAVEVVSEDRVRVRWLADYYNLDLNNPHRVLEAMFHLTEQVYNSYVQYNHASLKQYK